MAETRFDVVGIGNAIVDVLAHADDGFLAEHVDQHFQPTALEQGGVGQQIADGRPQANEDAKRNAQADPDDAPGGGITKLAYGLKKRAQHPDVPDFR